MDQADHQAWRSASIPEADLSPHIPFAELNEFGVGQLYNNQVRALCYMVQRATVGEMPASAAMANPANPARSSTPSG
jgi:hypothetical protein